jgi:hypothetical protein
MKRKIALFLIFPTLLWISSCKKSADPAPTVGTLTGTITKLNTTTKLSNVKLIVFDANTNAPVGASVTTDANGNYTISLNPGSYYAKVSGQGYDDIPSRGISAIPFDITTGVTTRNDYQMNASTLTNAGFISGKITTGGTALGGVLVVASDGTNAYSSLSDSQGNYTIFNVPANTYSVQGWIASYNSNQANATVASGSETANTHLSLTAGASGTVTGTITFLATTAVEVDVALTHPITHETIPGLSTMTAASNYTILKVPTGTFLARATYRNDDRVVDPDWILKNGEPTVTVSTSSIQRNFSLTGSMTLSSPTNAATSNQPFSVTSTTPTFSWNAYPSTNDYVIEVTNSNGKVIWGGFSGSGVTLTKKVSLPSSQTSVVFNYDGQATESLQPGRVYRWKVYASKNDNTNIPAWKLISSSEDQRGLIIINTAQ